MIINWAVREQASTFGRYVWNVLRSPLPSSIISSIHPDWMSEHVYRIHYCLIICAICLCARALKQWRWWWHAYLARIICYTENRNVMLWAFWPNVSIGLQAAVKFIMWITDFHRVSTAKMHGINCICSKCSAVYPNTNYQIITYNTSVFEMVHMPRKGWPDSQQ